MTDGPKRIADLIKLPDLARGDLRLNEYSYAIFGESAAGQDIGYLLTLHAHCYLPRRPTAEQQHKHVNGPHGLMIKAGDLFDPGANDLVPQPLPYGGKPRILLAYVGSYAKRYKTSQIDLGSSFSDFVSNMAGSATGGVKGSLTLWQKQFAALAAAQITVWANFGDHAKQRQIVIADQIEIWFSREPGQRSLFPSTVTLTDRYYELVTEHAMPVDWRALKALQGDPLALDLYTWLTYRLPRVRQRHGVLIGWADLHAQFGGTYSQVRQFRAAFNKALTKVAKVYLGAKVEPGKAGVLVRPSPPAVSRKTVVRLPHHARLDRK